MTCVLSKDVTQRNILIGSLVAGMVVLAALGCVLATRWQHILAELAQLRVNRVKRG